MNEIDFEETSFEGHTVKSNRTRTKQNNEMGKNDTMEIKWYLYIDKKVDGETNHHERNNEDQNVNINLCISSI